MLIRHYLKDETLIGDKTVDTKQQITDLINAPFKCVDRAAQTKELTIESSVGRRYHITIEPNGFLKVKGEAAVPQLFPIAGIKMWEYECKFIEKEIEFLCREIKTEEILNDQINQTTTD